MNLESNRTVRELALEIPGATRVFEKAGIDYCCGGQQSLADACAKAEVTIEDMMNSLEAAKASHAPPGEGPNFITMRLAEFIDHIVVKHHVFTKAELQRLRALIGKVCGVHGQNHPELARLKSLFETLSSELEPHMMKEERVLFPYIVGMENFAHSKNPGQMPFGTVANPVRILMLEHESAGRLLKEMRQLTSDYTVPSDACISYQTLYQALDVFEKDLHQHIHLENNILFPRAVEMEETIRG